MGRDSVIQVVGSVIGRDHPVDLKNYDVMILVETVKVSILFEMGQLI
jgi:hypothetical protein